MPLQTYQIAQTLVAGNSDRLSIDEFGRLIRSYYACKFIFLGNLSLEQTLSLRVYKNTYSRLAHRSDPDSLKFYRKFLLIAGAKEYQTYQNIDRVADERYREILDMMFKHRLYPTGETGTGTRIHVRQLDITFMHGFYGSSKDDSDHYLLNRIGDDTIEKAFKRLEVRNKRRVVCGHLEVPVAYVRTPNGTINKVTGKDLSSLTFDPQARYIIAPGALNHGHFALLRLGAKGRVSMDFKKLQLGAPVSQTI